VRHTYKTLAAATILVLSVFGAPSKAPAQTTPKLLAVPPTALKPADFENDALPWVSTADSFYFANNLSAPVDSYAYVPLSLPQKARIKGLTLHYVDNACGIDQELVVTLTRHDLATGRVQTMAKVTTEGVECVWDRRTMEAETIANAVVDNARYSYALTVLFSDGIDRLRFLGATIRYQ
jgi:hypothetical protein